MFKVESFNVKSLKAVSYIIDYYLESWQLQSADQSLKNLAPPFGLVLSEAEVKGRWFACKSKPEGLNLAESPTKTESFFYPIGAYILDKHNNWA